MNFIRSNLRWLSAGALLTFLASFGQTYFISAFAGEIRAEFSLSHGAWGAIYSTGTLASAAVMVWAGMLSDRFRVRGLGAVVLLGLAVACLVMAGNRASWALVGVIFLLRLFGQGMASHVAKVAMARWFVATRGKALAFASTGASLGEATLPLLAVALIPLLGWRGVWVGASVALVLLIPLLIGLLAQERTPQSQAGHGAATGLQGRHWSRSQVLRHRLFWMLMPTLVSPSAFATAFFFQQVHLADTKPWTHVEFVSMIPVYTVASLLTMMVSGWAVDRWGTWRLLPLFQIPLAAGFALLWAGDGLGALFGTFVLIGMMQGAQVTVPAAFWAETYGTAHLGSIKSMAMAIMVLGSAIGPVVSGGLIDKGLIFSDQAIWIALFILFACGLAALGLWQARRAD